jgi:hypothetical protein
MLFRLGEVLGQDCLYGTVPNNDSTQHNWGNRWRFSGCVELQRQSLGQHLVVVVEECQPFAARK